MNQKKKLDRRDEETQERVFHQIPPVYDSSSRILILGSFPSVKSREGCFFYHHPQNRFWKVVSGVLQVPMPGTVEEKRAFLLEHGIALWDVIASCRIEGSSDSSIRDATPNDLNRILQAAPIREIFVNGGTAWTYFCRTKKDWGVPAFKLPSTSPANAAWSLERLLETWSIIGNYL